jgi:F-type H+-transporting ATPase subunit delta
MAEIATIARPYAEALFKAATTELDATSVWLDELAALADQPQLQQFASSPTTTDAQVFELIAGIAKSPLPQKAQNFLRTVIANARLAVLPEIAAQFRSLKNSQSGSFDAVVFSAFPIDSAALPELAVTLEQRFGKKLNVTAQLEPELIGGIRVVVGDEVLDTSIKARLEQMKVALTA